MVCLCFKVQCIIVLLAVVYDTAITPLTDTQRQKEIIKSAQQPWNRHHDGSTEFLFYSVFISN